MEYFNALQRMYDVITCRYGDCCNTTITDLAGVKKWMKRNRDIIGSVSIVVAPEQCRIQMNRTFLCVQDAELNGKIAKYKYQMKKTKVFGGNKLN